MGRLALGVTLAAQLAAAAPSRAQSSAPKPTSRGEDLAPANGQTQGAEAGTSAAEAPVEEEGFGSYTAPTIAPRRRTYSLEECLALADRNHPNLWAARARLAFVHGQLEEARWTPFWQWGAQVLGGVLPPITGTAIYTGAPAAALNPSFGAGFQPFARVDVNGAVPIYTFGKITSARQAAEANVRVSEWDMERTRQQIRWDVRRAYFGLMFARDAKYFIDEMLERLDKGISGIREKLAKGDPSVSDIDRYRLDVYREEIMARAADAPRGETHAITALRFLTGVQTGFDIPDEPLKRPNAALGPVVQYLKAARLYRPEVNQARAGVVARTKWLEFMRARLYPDFGLGLSASYSTAPSAVIQNNAWVVDPFNRFGFGAALALRWSLDLLPQQARIEQAESQLEETRALERFALGGTAVEVEHAYANAMEAKNREEAWARAEYKSRQWISSVQNAIDVGAQDERALMEPLRAYANARVSHLQALMDYNNALSFLAFVSGWDAAAPTGA
jgi:outer membrane protein TolC